MYELYVNKTFDDGIHAYYVNVKKKTKLRMESRDRRFRMDAFKW